MRTEWRAFHYSMKQRGIFGSIKNGALFALDEPWLSIGLGLALIFGRWAEAALFIILMVSVSALRLSGRVIDRLLAGENEAKARVKELERLLEDADTVETEEFKAIYAAAVDSHKAFTAGARRATPFFRKEVGLSVARLTRVRIELIMAMVNAKLRSQGIRTEVRCDSTDDDLAEAWLRGSFGE